MDVNAKNKNSRTLLLLDPYPRDNPYQMTASERRSIWFPKLSLPVIAAYTPPGWDVRLVDEAVQEIDVDQHVRPGRHFRDDVLRASGL